MNLYVWKLKKNIIKKLIVISLCILFIGFQTSTIEAVENYPGVNFVLGLKDYGYGYDKFHEGLARFQKLDESGFREGYIDITGKEVINIEWPNNFSEGLAAAVKDGKKGFINRNGKFVISPQYEFALSFSEGLAAIQKNNKWGYIDKKGREIIKPVYDYAESFQNGMAIVGLTYNNRERDYRFGIVNNKGKEVVKPQYDYARGYSENLAAVGKDGKCGYVDKTGKIVIKMQYDNTDSFYNGKAIVFLKNKGFGFINKSGKIIIKPQYAGIKPFCEGVACFSRGLKKGYIGGFIDETGKEIIKFENGYTEDFHEGLSKVVKDGKQFFIDKKGKKVIDLKYDIIGNFNEGLAYVQKDNKYGYIDKTGKEVIGLYFDGVSDFSNGLAIVVKDGKLGCISSPLDIPDAWARDKVRAAINVNLVPTYMQFGYKQYIKRSDFITLIISFIKVKTGKDIDTYISERNLNTKDNPFNDINDNEVDVIAAYKLGIINGAGDGNFYPYRDITQQEMANILAKTAKLLNIVTINQGASNKDKIKDWISIITGNQSKYINSTGKYTRQQAVIIILNLYKDFN